MSTVSSNTFRHHFTSPVNKATISQIRQESSLAFPLSPSAFSYPAPPPRLALNSIPLSLLGSTSHKSLHLINLATLDFPSWGFTSLSLCGEPLPRWAAAMVHTCHLSAQEVKRRRLPRAWHQPRLGNSDFKGNLGYRVRPGLTSCCKQQKEHRNLLL